MWQHNANDHRVSSAYIDCKQTDTVTCSWRMDKTSPRWKNVPTPCMRNTPVTLLGTCFQILDNGNLCINIDFITLPSPTPPASALPQPVRKMTTGNYCKFAASAPSWVTANPTVQASGSSLSNEHEESSLNLYALTFCCFLISNTNH